MTPDLKRLCEAARDAEETWFRNTPEDRSAAIVRAVLMALREPAIEHRHDPSVDPYRAAMTVAMINHILAEPAKA